MWVDAFSNVFSCFNTLLDGMFVEDIVKPFVDYGKGIKRVG
jgi:hypothetical protein